MADGFIVRKGGVGGEPIPQPTITLVSKTFDSITFTLTNNSIAEQDVTFGLTTPPTTTTITLASQATSGNQTFTGLDANTEVTIFAQAADGVIAELSVTTDPAPVFTAATGGTTLEYDDGGKRYKSHTFTSNGNFVVSTVGDNIDDRNKVDYLIIAGGGGGGANFSSVSTAGGSGGGAGGFRTTVGTQGGNGTLDSKVTVTATTHSVTIGDGGAGAVRASGGLGTKGTDSSVTFASTLNSEGGGGGASRNEPQAGGNGGSGGGGNIGEAGGTGTANQGFDGGSSTSTPSGGGGAGQAGTNGGTDFDIGYKGGDGLANLLRTGSNETRAGGGGSGGRTTGVAGSGGAGGGGAGGQGAQNGFNGTANTGGGGGGAGGAINSAQNGGNGGSGLVVIRYEIAPSV